jgi:hypothetical protein
VIVELRVDLGVGREEEPEELDAAARQLQRELLQLDVFEVQRIAGEPPPPGTRAADAAILGGLAVTAGREMIGAVIRTLVQWLSRRSNRSVKLTIGDDSIELSDVSAEDQRRLVDSFLARHAVGV